MHDYDSEFNNCAVGGSRGIDDQSVPLPFDVIIRRLLSDVEAGKLQLPRYLLLTFKHHQRHLWNTGNNIDWYYNMLRIAEDCVYMHLSKHNT